MDFTIYEAYLDKIDLIKTTPLLKAGVVLLVYLCSAKVVDLVFSRLFMRLASYTKTDLDNRLLTYLHRPVYWTVGLVGGLHAVIYLSLPEPWHLVVPRVLKSMMVVVWWIALFAAVKELIAYRIESLKGSGKVGQDLFLIFKNFIYIGLFCMGAMWILSIWQVDLTPLFASAGIAGIALGFAAKDTLANFFGGISIFFDRSYKTGDYVILDSGERGEVVDIGIRSTKIKTRDDVLITIPNSIMANTKIINETAPVPRYRIRLPVGVAYGSDLKLVERVLVDTAHAHHLVKKDPGPRARIRRFGDSSIDFELLCWVRDPADRGLVMHELFLAVYQAFEQEGISIPFPQMDVHLFRDGEVAS